MSTKFHVENGFLKMKTWHECFILFQKQCHKELLDVFRFKSIFIWLFWFTPMFLPLRLDMKQSKQQPH